MVLVNVDCGYSTYSLNVALRSQEYVYGIDLVPGTDDDGTYSRNMVLSHICQKLSGFNL